MPVQEALLRDLVAEKACPRLTEAVTAVAGEQDPATLPYRQLLQVLQSLPITEYSGDYEASCRALLDAMRAGDDPERMKTLAAEICNEVPSDWGMTSGTTGSSKYFPMTRNNLERTIRSTGRHTSEVQLIKFPLQPFKQPTYDSSSHAEQDGMHQQQQQQQEQEQYEWRHRTLSMALAGPCEELPGGQFVGSISSVFMSKFSKLGIVLDRDLEGQDITTRPAKLMYAMAKPGVEAAPRYYALWLCAAAEPGLERVTTFTDLFAGNMLSAVSVMQHHWREMVDDLNAGKLSCSLAQGLPDEAATIINEQLSSMPAAARAANAAHIRQAMMAHAAAEAAGQAQPLLGLLMPNLHAVTVVVTGSHSKFWPSLRRLIPQHVPVCTPWHAGTEGLFGISHQLIQPGPWDTSMEPIDQQYVMMATGNCFFEYVPVQQDNSSSSSGGNDDSSDGGTGRARGSYGDVCGRDTSGQRGHLQPVVAAMAAVDLQQQQQQQRVLTMDDLQVGHEYELLITTFAGLTRYRLGDVVRVEGLVPFDTSTCLEAQPGADPQNVLHLPLVSFRGRVGVVLNLIWEKYDEGQLLNAVRDTVKDLLQQQQQQQQQQLAFSGLAEFTVCENNLQETDKHYTFFWELLPSTPAAATAGAAVEPPSDAAAVADCIPSPSPPAPSAAAAAALTVSKETLSNWETVLNQNLGLHNTVYAGLLAAGQIGPARIQLVAPGTFSALQELQVQAKRISPSQFKMATVMAADSEGVLFLSERVVSRT